MRLSEIALFTKIVVRMRRDDRGIRDKGAPDSERDAQHRKFHISCSGIFETSFASFDTFTANFANGLQFYC